MARRIVSMTTQSPTATADTTDLVDATYPFCLIGGSSTQRNLIWEVSIAGQAPASSSPTFMILGGDSQVATGGNSNGTGQQDTAIDPSTAALAAPAKTGNTNATLKPRRSSADHLQNCSLNAYGGNYFWRANRVEECVSMYGSAAVAAGIRGEVSLSAFTGGTPGLCGSHMIYETL